MKESPGSMKLKHYRMQDCTSPEIRAYLEKNRTVILPYGICEQHGAHLPLDTDIRNAEYAAHALAVKLGCLTAPVLNYTFSGGMLPGTINVTPNTFSTLVGEIVQSLAMQGFRNIIILPGHGGSESLLHLKESLRILKWTDPALADVMILIATLWDFSPSLMKIFKGRDYHAAMWETSLMLHWCPEVVRRDRVMLDEPAVAERLRQDPDSYQLRESLTDFPYEIVRTTQRSDVRIGVMGYPEKASAELGARIEKEFLENASVQIRKALRKADAARKSGARIRHDNGETLKICR